MRLEDMHCKHCNRTPLEVNFIQIEVCTSCWRGRKIHGENHVIKFYSRRKAHDPSGNTCECGMFKTIAAKRCAECFNSDRPKRSVSDAAYEVSDVTPMSSYLPPRDVDEPEKSVREMRADTLEWLRVHCPNAYGRPDERLLAPSVVGWPDVDG